jgi:hypothetical protein
MGLDPARIPGSMVMQPADLVEASLVGLRRGEVICVPALDDADRLARLDEDQRSVWEHSGSGTIAPRYGE